MIGLAAAVPPGAAAAGRLARGLGRTAVRVVPSFFEKFQRRAQEAAEALVRGLRPAEDVAALSASARAAGADFIPAKNISRVLGEIRLPSTPANPRLVQVKTTIENLQGAMRAGSVRLDDLEAIRRDIGPLLQSNNAPAELRGIYGAIVTDLEKAAASGGVGASLARETARAFKQDLGAAKVAELFESATTRRVISGADVPALNVGRFGKLIHDPKTRKALETQLGPDALRTLDAFVHRFRSLPPDVAFNGWSRMIAALGGIAGGGAAGMAAIGGPAGVVIVALTPEVVTNAALVGRNPAVLNRLMTTLLQGARAHQTATAQRRR
jgi:hypothetical protein